MKVKVDLKALVTIEREITPHKPDELLSRVWGLGTVEVEVPDEWIKVTEVIPDSHVSVSIRGLRIVKPEKPKESEVKG
jgi:hypothetical protein